MVGQIAVSTEPDAVHGSISGDMDNVTHAFIGAAMAECAVPQGASSRTRTILITAGVIAANAPDIDLLYTRITEAPLGYLLHHRGHSHTLPGLAVLGVAIWSGLKVLPHAKAALQEAGLWPPSRTATAAATPARPVPAGGVRGS